MFKWSCVIYVVICSLCFAQQDSTRISIITLVDGSEIKGFITQQDSSTIEFKTLSGVEMNLNKIQIKGIEEVKGTWQNGKFMTQDPHSSRLFFAPTARTLKSGQVYFTAYEIFFPSIGIGIGDFLTVTGGMSIFTGSPEQILFVAPKLRLVNLDAFQLSGGFIYAGILDQSFGVTYGVFTAGSSAASFTGGLGFGFVNGEFADNPFLMVGGEVQLTNSFKLITENWIVPSEEFSLISFGMRFFGKNLAADFGLIKIPDLNEGFPFFPWVGFAYNF